MRLRTAVTLLAATGVLALAVGGWSVPSAYAQDAGPVVLSEGHVDAFEVSLRDGELVLMLKDDTVFGQSVFRDPAEVILHLAPESAWEVPGWTAGLPEWAFLGEPGDGRCSSGRMRISTGCSRPRASTR